MNYANLISAMSAVIKANGNNEITGDLLQQVLRAIINSLGQGYQFMGVATTATNPGTQDARLFYVAEGPGIYSNFGPLTVPDDGQVYLLVLGSSWAAVQLPIPTFAGFSDLVTEVAGKMALVPTATEGDVAEFGDAGQVRDGGVQTSALARRDAGATAGNLAEFDGNGDPKDSGIAAGDVMKIPAGLMPFGPAGLAEALLDTDSAGNVQEFSLRKGGGDGGAYFRRLLGNTKAFNQLVEGNVADEVAGWTAYRATASVADGVATITPSVTDNTCGYATPTTLGIRWISGHNYLLKAIVKADSSNLLTFSAYVGGIAGAPTKRGTGSWMELVGIVTADGSMASYNSFRVAVVQSIDANQTPFYVKSIICIDLTATPDNSTTPEEFREKYPLLYYAYGRKLIHNKVAKVITKGANQWDEVWESGTINNVTGEDTPSANAIRSKNYYPIVGGAEYYIAFSARISATTAFIFFYDAAKNYIGYLSRKNTTFTPPANAAYFRIRVGDSSNPVTTYKDDVCINLSDAEINGQYFPYWERELALDITNQEDTDGNKPFAEGMMSAGSAADYANEVGGAKVMGVVDLGTLTWIRGGSNPAYFYANVTGRAAGYNNIICAQLSTKQTSTITGIEDNQMVGSTSADTIYVRADAYNDAATFKTAMNGVKLVYELATPVPFTWKEPLNTGIKVSKYGTEEITPAQTENIDNAPFRAVTTYSISVANLIAALSALGNRGGAKGSLGGGNQEENPENEELIPEEESPKEEAPKEEETPVVEPTPEVQSKK